jgi:hypothetical protein
MNMKEFKDKPFTVVIDSEDADILKNWTDESISKNKTVYSLFL